MNQKDWVEYFKVVNGRNPTASEFSEALKNKEFTLQSNQDDNRQKELKDALDEQKSIIDKEDWIASFEANNGRRPTPAEFSEALNRGEFVFSSDTFNALRVCCWFTWFDREESLGQRTMDTDDNISSFNFCSLLPDICVLGNFFDPSYVASNC